MNKDEIFKNSNGVSFKIINGEKWAIHKETQEPVMLLSEYKERLLIFLNQMAGKVNKNIPVNKIVEVLQD
tara:strand:+ start:381 stop:590 length:210 start_codon:yes stop_codon:yes gene_type:complete